MNFYSLKVDLKSNCDWRILWDLPLERAIQKITLSSGRYAMYLALRSALRAVDWSGLCRKSIAQTSQQYAAALGRCAKTKALDKKGIQ